ncbi:MAG: hypothetical protein U5L96_14810 [Owenweeksia sp.]|nr:hypothetical protein [Owenweeksia sp.]
MKDILKDFESLPSPGVNYRIDSNRADDYRERLSLLTENGLIGHCDCAW